MHLAGLILLVLLIGFPATSSSAQQPLNLGFERLSTEGPTRPWNWTPISYAPGATVLVDNSVSQEGQRSVRISRVDQEPTEFTHALATYMKPLAAKGKQARVSGWIKSENLSGHALFSIQAWADFNVLRADSSHSRVDLQSSGSSDWTRYEAEIDVPADTETLVITIDMLGVGSVWFDGLVLEIDGRPVQSLPVARKTTMDEIEWLAQHAASLRSVDPSQVSNQSDLDDLKSLDSMLGDARVIALGESSHGTSEFFRLKHRVLQYLVLHHDLRLFAIEDQQLEMEKVNAYVKGGAGTAEEAMSGMFGVWATREVLSLVEWIRDYNQEHPDDPVEFVGFDMQNPSLPIDSLLAFTKHYDRNLYPTLSSLLTDYREAWRQNGYPQYFVQDSVHHRWADSAEAAWHLVNARQSSWYKRAKNKQDSLSVEWAVQNARVTAQAGRYIFNHQPDRDSSMALNLKWHLDRRGPDARAVVWAHDSHISKGEAATTEGNYFLSSMGAYLDRLYGDDYRAFGIMSFDGTYTATQSMWGGPQDLILVDAFPAPEGSLEEAFHRVAQLLDSPYCLINLQSAKTDSRGKMLLEQRPYRFIGYAAEDYGFNGSIEIGHQFDGLFFVDQTTGTHPMRISPWPPERN